jgi:hypothetical protein
VIISPNCQKRYSPWSEFLASLLGRVRQIEVNADLFLGSRQTQVTPFQFHKRSQLFIRTHDETLSVGGERQQ